MSSPAYPPFTNSSSRTSVMQETGSGGVLSGVRSRRTRSGTGSHVRANSFPAVHGGPHGGLGQGSSHSQLVSSVFVVLVYTLLNFTCVDRVGGAGSACRAVSRGRLIHLLGRSGARVSGLRRHGARLADRLGSLGSTTGRRRRTHGVTGRGRRADNLVSNQLPTGNGNVAIAIDHNSASEVSTSVVFGLVRRLHGTNTRIVTVGRIHIITSACVRSTSRKLVSSNATVGPPCIIGTVNGPRRLSGTISVTKKINTRLRIGCKTGIGIRTSSGIVVSRIHRTARGGCTGAMR